MTSRNFPSSSQSHMQSSGGVALASSPAVAIPPSHKLKASSSSSSTSSLSNSAGTSSTPQLHMRRRQSLLLQIPPGAAGHGHVHHPQLLHIPIPPTLQNSPLLQSPNSVFRRQYNANRTPGEEEERWLRDTVPMNAPAPQHTQMGASGSSASRGNAGAGHGHGHDGSLAASVPPRTDALRPPMPPTILTKPAPGGGYSQHAYPAPSSSGRNAGAASSSGTHSRTL